MPKRKSGMSVFCDSVHTESVVPKHNKTNRKTILI